MAASAERPYGLSPRKIRDNFGIAVQHRDWRR